MKFPYSSIITAAGEVTLKLEVLAWPAHVRFFEFSSSEEESVILGHSGFLEFFLATFDGVRDELTLEQNLPPAA